MFSADAPSREKSWWACLHGVYCTIQILFGLLCALGDVLWFCDCYNLGVMHLMLYDYNHRPDPLLRVQTAVVSYFEVLCVVGVSGVDPCWLQLNFCSSWLQRCRDPSMSRFH